jgi:iron complex outermembrane recepter protein
MKKQAILFLITFLVIQHSFAQTITGSIKDHDGKGIEYASIGVMNAKDSTLIKGGYSEDKGKFSIELSDFSGKYFISAAMVGYSNADSKVFESTGAALLVEDIVLKKSNQELGEVVVVNKRPLIEVKNEKVIMNVENTINSSGYNALELLKKAPGVVVGIKDDISYKGKGDVQIFIDGKPAGVGGGDLSIVLKSLPSDGIEAIELISNPGAKYEASGNGGIINIRLKKNKNLGFNGNLGAGFRYGLLPKYDGSIGLNYRTEKLNFFSNYNIGNAKNEGNAVYHQIQQGIDLDRQIKSTDQYTYHQFKLGTDYSIDRKSTIGVLFSGMSAQNYVEQNTTYTNFRTIGSDKIDSLLIGGTTNGFDFKNLTYNLNYKYEDTSGHQLNIDYDRLVFDKNQNGVSPNYVTLPDVLTRLREISFKTISTSPVTINAFKADYEQNLWKGKFGTGIKYSNVNSEYTYDVFKIANNQTIQDISNGSLFKYKENITAAYLNFNREINSKTSFQLGLRMENTNSEGVGIAPNKPDLVLPYNYTGFFPSAAFTYKVNPKNTLNINYSRRIDRPNYRNLNPSVYTLDALTTIKGNPFLQPQYTNSISLNHTWADKINTSIGFSRTTDVFTSYPDTFQNKGGVLVQSKNNGILDNYNISISLPITFSQAWTANLNANAFYNVRDYYLDANFNGNFGQGSYSLNLQNNYTLSKTLSLELSGYYNSPQLDPGALTRYFATGNIDIGLTQKLWDGDGVLKISISDILKTNFWHQIEDYSKYYFSEGRQYYESRQLRLNFTYKFGNKKVKDARQRSTSSQDEGRRI